MLSPRRSGCLCSFRPQSESCRSTFSGTLYSRRRYIGRAERAASRKTGKSGGSSPHAADSFRPYASGLYRRFRSFSVRRPLFRNRPVRCYLLSDPGRGNPFLRPVRRTPRQGRCLRITGTCIPVDHTSGRKQFFCNRTSPMPGQDAVDSKRIPV